MVVLIQRLDGSRLALLYISRPSCPACPRSGVWLCPCADEPMEQAAAAADLRQRLHNAGAAERCLSRDSLDCEPVEASRYNNPSEASELCGPHAPRAAARCELCIQYSEVKHVTCRHCSGSTAPWGDAQPSHRRSAVYDDDLDDADAEVPYLHLNLVHLVAACSIAICFNSCRLIGMMYFTASIDGGRQPPRKAAAAAGQRQR